MKGPLILIALIAVNGVAGAQTPDCSGVAGWQQQGPVREYGPDNLFDYMDGNAEGYLIYRFVNMKGVTCKKGDDTILIDFHEMADPEYAYGLFCTNRDVRLPNEAIGMGGQVLPRKATFAKGAYYVEISASPEGDHSAALQGFVAGMEKHIEGRSTPPQALSWFAEEKLVSARLIPESVLGLRALKRGYVAQYEAGKAFIVMEESVESASAVMKKLRSRLGDTTPAAVGDEAFQAKDQYLGGLCFFRKGRYLAGYSNLPDAQSAVARAAALVARLP